MRMVVVGDALTDVVVQQRAEPAVGSDAEARIHVTDGGSGANVAAWLAHLGADVHLIARIGADARGRLRRDALHGQGVHAHLTLDPRRETGTILVIVDLDGERTMLTDRGASAGLEPEDLPPPLFTSPAHLHLSGYVLLDDGCRAAGQRALELARGAGMSVSVSPASVAPLRSAGPQRFLADTDGADLCIANLAEARVLADRPDADPADVADALSIHYPQVVVTAGAAGSAWAADGQTTVTAPAPVSQVTDTTGAGDAFTAGFLVAWARGDDARAALTAGADVAATAVGQIGAAVPRGGETR